MQILNIPNLMLSASIESFLKLMVTLLIFVFVLFITYLTAKWVGGYQKVRMKSKNLQMLETIPAGANKMISLVRAGSVYLVLSIGKDEIHPLATLTEDQLTDLSFQDEVCSSSIGTESFQEILGQLKDKMSVKSNDNKQ